MKPKSQGRFGAWRPRQCQTRFFIAGCVAAWGVGTAWSEVLVRDSFDYPDGPLVTVSDGRWITHNGSVPGEVDVTQATVSLTEAETEDVSVRLPGGPFRADGTCHVFYASFRVRCSKLPGGTGTYFAHFKDSANGFRARVWAFTNGAVPGCYRLGISSTSHSLMSATNPANLTLETGYRVVCRLANTNSVSTLWIDPDNELDPGVRTGEGTSGFTVAAFALRQASSGGVWSIDDLVVATTFAEVVPPMPPGDLTTLSFLTYNVSGNDTQDWSTTNLQVQAIGRQMQFLQPDILAFNEIPRHQTWQMTNFVAAYLPGYYLATNSGTDGYLRSVIASRFAIARSDSWLDGASLLSFGYSNTYPSFTRDLFEAEIHVPGFPRPLHVFTAHLKAGRNTNDLARRAAEASAISNFLVTSFLPTKGWRPHLLAGDLNEDIFRPPSESRQPVQRLANSATGLQLITPRNPLDQDDRTISSRTTLHSRYDYALPSTLLSANIKTSHVFRTDLLDPLPDGLQANDSQTASDHLPVVVVFGNPFANFFRVTDFTASPEQVRLNWQGVPGCRYHVESSSDLNTWTLLTAPLLATNQSLFWETNRSHIARFYRIARIP